MFERLFSRNIVLFACSFLLLAHTASAQFRGAIQGTVTDASGAVVPNASVTLTNSETKKTQSTTGSAEGFYRFSGLPPGRYSVEVVRQGFKKASLQDVALRGEETQGVDLSLETGGTTETVTVSATAAPTLQTENANVSMQLSEDAVRTLPQIGRDPYNLLRLAPGVFGDASRSNSGQANGLPNTTGPGGSNLSVFQTENQVQIVANGQRLSQNNYQIDGVSVNSLTWGGAAVVTPNQESIKSIRVSSGDYNAESGRNSGAQVEVVSQNGTNRLHGSGVFKYDDPAFNAYNKFGGPNAAPVRVNNFLRQFAASVGGPVIKNKLFFFFSYEGLRQSSTNYTTTYVETPQYRQQVVAARPNSLISQVFSNAGIAPRVVSYLSVPCPGGFAPGNCKPVNGGLDIGSLTGARGQYVDYFANPTGGGLDGIPDIAFAQLAVPSSSQGNQYNGRIDYNLSSKDSLAASLYVTKFDGYSADGGSDSRPLADIANSPTNTAAVITYNRILSPTTLNEARFNFTRFYSNQLTAAASTNFGIPRLEIEALPLPARITFGPQWAETTPSLAAQNTFEFRDSFSKIQGNHAFRVGGEIRWEQNNDNLVGGSRPLYTFRGLNNLANDTPVFEQINADPTTGAPAAAQRYFRTKDYAVFFQDEFKLRPDLTITYGIRWEYFTPLTEKQNRITNLELTTPFSLAGAKLQPVKQLTNPDYNNFAPRFGFAYNPTWRKNLVVRGGFGIYYTRVPDVLFANTRGNLPSFARYGICCGDNNSPFANGQILYALGSSNSIYSYPVNPKLAVGIDPVTGGLNGGAQTEVWGAQRDFPNGYAYIYSWEFQYALPSNMIASAGYQGSADHKLIRLVNQKFLYPSPANFPFNAVYFPQPDVNSNFNSLNLRLARTFTQGLGLEAKYRWSKSIDNLSYEGPGAVTNQTYPQDNHSERGPSDFDAKHFFVVSGQYELPWYKKQQGLIGKVLGGYQVAGIMTYHTGFPYTVKIGQSVNTPGGPTLGPIRPTQYFGNAQYSSSNDALINGTNYPLGGAAYFDIKDAGAPGIGRNSFRGPNYFGTDLTLVKTIKLPASWHLGEAGLIDVRANLYNVFNNLNLTPFGFYDSGVFADSGQFGRATQPALAGRVVEFQARFSF